MGLTISSDLNYKSQLWKYGKTPKDVMPAMLKNPINTRNQKQKLLPKSEISNTLKI